MTSAGVAVYLWLVHVVRALTRGDLTGGVAVWIVTGLWTLTLTLATFALVYTIGWLIESVAALTRARRTAERCCWSPSRLPSSRVFLRRIVLPTLSLQTFDAWVVSACAGAAVAISWSGVARRRMARLARRGAVAPGGRARTIAAAGALLVPPLSLLALGLVERIDWAFVGQRFIVVSAWALTFGFALRATRDLVRHERAFSAFAMASGGAAARGPRRGPRAAACRLDPGDREGRWPLRADGGLRAARCGRRRVPAGLEPVCRPQGI